MKPEPADDDQPNQVRCHLGAILTARNITLTELSARVGVSVVNLSVLKNDRARAVRFSTLSAICSALDCQPGDLFTVTTPLAPPRRGSSDPALTA